MFAILVAVLGMPALALRRRYPSGANVPLSKLVPSDDFAPDLPCPWCKGPTFEVDASCPSCGRRFG
mgnify:CR=1 FL=1